VTGQICKNTCKLGDYKNAGFYITIAIESFLSLDLADAYIGRLNLNAISNAIASSTVDITPEDIQILGYSLDNKEIKQNSHGYEIGVDALFSLLTELSQNKITNFNVKKTLRKLLLKADEQTLNAVKEEIMSQLGEKGYYQMIDELGVESLQTPKDLETKTDNTRVRRRKRSMDEKKSAEKKKPVTIERKKYEFKQG